MPSWYDNLTDTCANCCREAGKHNGASYCPLGNGGKFSESEKFTHASKADSELIEPLNVLCQNCGNRRGEHAHSGKACPIFSPDQKWSVGYHPSSMFLATNPIQQKPMGWHPDFTAFPYAHTPLKDLVEANSQPAPVKAKPSKKEKKTKPWEEKKFNTPKEPKPGLVYYKTVPEPKNPCAEVPIYDELLETEHAKLKEYLLGGPSQLSTTSEPTGAKAITKEDLQNLIESLKGANAKPFNYQYQYYETPLEQHGVEQRREQGLDKLIDDFTNRYGRGLPTLQFAKRLLEFAEREGYRYGYINPEVSQLRQKMEQQEQYLAHLNKENRQHKAELAALKTQMAGMVQKARPVIPVSFEQNGRKFKTD